jgi:hypothetical protein
VTRMPDLWAERDLPVLQSIVRRVIANDYAASQDVARDTGLPDQIVDRSVRQLRDAGYVNAHFEGGGGLGVMGVNPIALTTTGAWPTPESLVDRLLDALEQSIAAAPSEAERSRRQRALDGLSLASVKGPGSCHDLGTTSVGS